MQGAVHVGLGHGDIIFKASRHGLPKGVDYAECGVAVVYRVDYHAYSYEVVYLVYGLLLADSLFVYAVKVLGAAGKRSLYSRLLQRLFYLLHGLVQGVHALLLIRYHGLLQLFVLFRPEVLHAEILQLALHGAHAEAMCERRIDIQRLAGLAYLLFLAAILEGTHIVQSVVELDYDHPDIVCDGEEHLAEALRLYVLAAYHLVLSGFSKLCYAVYHAGDILTKHGRELFVGYILAVLYHIMHETGQYGMAVHAHIGKHYGYVFRVGIIGLAGMAGLMGVNLLGKLNSPVQRLHFLRCECL